MFPIFVVLLSGLLVIGFTMLVAVGFCFAIAYTMTHFVATLDVETALIPASILTTTVLALIASAFKFWVLENVKAARLPSLYDDDDEDRDDVEDEDDEVRDIVVDVTTKPGKSEKVVKKMRGHR